MTRGCRNGWGRAEALWLPRIFKVYAPFREDRKKVSWCIHVQIKFYFRKMSLPPLLHPALIFLVSNSTLTLVAAQTTRGSLVRVASSGLLIGSALIFHPALRHFVDSTGWVARVPAGAIFWALITYLDRLILRGWDYEHYGPRVANSNQSEHASETQDGKDDISYPGTRMDFGSEVSGSARGIGRFWEVKNTPLFSKLQPEFVPSRSVFIFVQAIAAVTCYYVNNYLADVTLSLDPSLLDARHVPLLTRISNVTSAEIRTRIVATLGYWIMQYCMLQFFYSIAGIIGAVTNPKDIRLWRPLFGSLSDGFTIRNLWGSAKCFLSEPIVMLTVLQQIMASDAAIGA